RPFASASETASAAALPGRDEHGDGVRRRPARVSSKQSPARARKNRGRDAPRQTRCGPCRTRKRERPAGRAGCPGNRPPRPGRARRGARQMLPPSIPTTRDPHWLGSWIIQPPAPPDCAVVERVGQTQQSLAHAIEEEPREQDTCDELSRAKGVQKARTLRERQSGRFLQARRTEQ